MSAPSLPSAPGGVMQLAAHRIHVHVSGPAVGPGAPAPAVLLHSTGMSGLQWRRLQKTLGKTRPVLAPDLIAYGESEAYRGEGPFETRFDLQVVLDLLGHLGSVSEGPVDLIGHSYGGRLAFLAALARPELVCSLSCFEPVLFGVLRSTNHVEAQAELNAANTDGRFLDLEFGGSEAWLARFVDYWNGPGAWVEFAEPLKDAFRRSARKIFEEVRETTLDETPHTFVEGLRTPTLLIRGRESTIAGRAVCQELVARMPNARLAEVEGGHMAPLTNGRAVNHLILAFLAERSGR